MALTGGETGFDHVQETPKQLIEIGCSVLHIVIFGLLSRVFVGGTQQLAKLAQLGVHSCL